MRVTHYDRLIHYLTDWDRKSKGRRASGLALLFEAASRAQAYPTLAEGVREEFDPTFPPVRRWLREYGAKGEGDGDAV